MSSDSDMRASTVYQSDFKVIRSNLGKGLVLHDIDTTTNKLYFTRSDEPNKIGTVQEYDKELNQLRIIAGNGVTGSYYPSGRAREIPLGNLADAKVFNHKLYFVEYLCVIREMSLVETNPNVTTIAGVINGCGDYNGENIAATSAYIGPTTLFIDSIGTIYFGDLTYRVRKIVSGFVTTIAGTGIQDIGTSFSPGISYPAIQTNISSILAIAVDSSSNVFFISKNVLFRLFNDSFTLIGPKYIVNDGQFYNGDGFNASLAGHSLITNLFIDSFDNLYTVDAYRVRMVLKQTHIIHTILGIGYPPKVAPTNGADPIRTAIALTKSRVVADTTGGIYFNDDSKYYSLYYFHRHSPSDDTGRRIMTVAGGLSTSHTDNQNAHLVGFDILGPIWVDSNGKIYLTDTQDPYERIRTIDPFTHIVTSIAGSTQGFENHSPSLSKFYGLQQVWGTTDGKIYVLEAYNHFIRKFDLKNLSSPMIIVAGNQLSSRPKDGMKATASSIGYPHRMWVNTNGDLYVADSWNCNIYEINTAGLIYTILGIGDYGTAPIGNTSKNTQIGAPEGIIGDTVGNIYVGMTSTGAVVYKLYNRKIDYDYSIEYYAGGHYNGWGFESSYNGDRLPATSTNFNYITGIGIDKDSNLYVLDNGLNVIRMIDPVTKVAGIIVGKGEDYPTAEYFGDGYSAIGAGIISNGVLFVDSIKGIYLTGTGYPRSAIRYITPPESSTDPTFVPTLAPITAISSSSSSNEISDLEVFYIAFFPGLVILLVVVTGIIYYFCYKKGSSATGSYNQINGNNQGEENHVRNIENNPGDVKSLELVAPSSFVEESI